MKIHIQNPKFIISEHRMHWHVLNPKISGSVEFSYKRLNCPLIDLSKSRLSIRFEIKHSIKKNYETIYFNSYLTNTICPLKDSLQNFGLKKFRNSTSWWIELSYNIEHTEDISKLHLILVCKVSNWYNWKNKKAR